MPTKNSLISELCMKVPKQTTKKALSLIKAHLEKGAAKIPGVTLTIKSFDSTSEPYKITRESPGNAIAKSVLQKLYGAEPVYGWEGGSIALFSLLQRELSVDTTMFAFGLHNENAHAPNEFTKIEQLRFAERAYALLLAELGSHWQTVTAAIKEDL